MTLHAAMYMSLMGAKGLLRVNRLSADAAHSLADKMLATGKVKMKYPDRVFLNEFAVETVAPLTAEKLLGSIGGQGYTRRREADRELTSCRCYRDVRSC